MNASTVSHLTLSLVATAMITVACAADLPANNEAPATVEQSETTDDADAPTPEAIKAAVNAAAATLVLEASAAEDAAFKHNAVPAGPHTPAWRTVEHAELNEAQQLAHRRAVSARTSLGAQLIGILSESLAAFGPEHTVEVCSELAPKIAEDVGYRYRVAVGRTSLRTRNANNFAPLWAQDVVEANESEEHIMLGPDDRVGLLTPIVTGELCTRCHGHVDTLEPSVIAAIQRHYPLDQATGFRTGDLRGWFWVDAPLIDPPQVYAESHPSAPNAREALEALEALDAAEKAAAEAADNADSADDAVDNDAANADAPATAEDAADAAPR